MHGAVSVGLVHVEAYEADPVASAATETAAAITAAVASRRVVVVVVVAVIGVPVPPRVP